MEERPERLRSSQQKAEPSEMWEKRQYRSFFLCLGLCNVATRKGPVQCLAVLFIKYSGLPKYLLPNVHILVDIWSTSIFFCAFPTI